MVIWVRYQSRNIDMKDMKKNKYQKKKKKLRIA